MVKLARGLSLSPFHREWLAKDIVAGVVLTTLLVPQGMAYAELAGLPPITGLYTSIMCLLGYAVFGPSRILVLGPDSSLGPMIAATILPLIAAKGDPKRAVALASLLAIMVAAIMIVAAMAKLGFIADLISKPTMIGYMNGLALTILVGQLPKLFGFKIDAEGLISEFTAFVRGLAHGEAVAAAAAVGIAGIVLILVLQRWLPKIPAVLIMVVLAIAATTVFGLADRGVSLVGVLPKGFPPLTLPSVRLDDLGPLFAGALGIALVSLADTISTSSAFAARTGQEVDGNSEMIGIGVANLAAGFSRASRSARAGQGRRWRNGQAPRPSSPGSPEAVLITLMIVLVPGLFRNLAPARAGGGGDHRFAFLADIPGAVRLWRQRKAECLLPSRPSSAWSGRCAARIAVAVGLSILNVFRRRGGLTTRCSGGWRGAGYHDVQFLSHASQLPGLVIYRFDPPLFFANVKTFRDEVRRLARADPPPSWVVIAAEPVTDVDTTASDVPRDSTKLTPRASAWSSRNSGPGPAEDRTLRADPHDRPRPLLPTIGAAVKAFRQETGTDWPSDQPAQ